MKNGNRMFRALLANVAIAALCVAVPAISQASTLISVTGRVSPNTPSAVDGGAYGQSFSLTGDFTGVSIIADTICFSCSGTVTLTDAIGPTATFGNLIQAAAFGGAATLFSNLMLGPGDYFIVIAITAGGFGWNASDARVVTETGGSSVGPSLLPSSVALVPYQSNFTIFHPDFLFTVEGNSAAAPAPVPVPEPSSFFLMLVAGAAISQRRRFSREQK